VSPSSDLSGLERGGNAATFAPDLPRRFFIVKRESFSDNLYLTSHSCHFRTSSRSPLGPRLKLSTSDEQSVSHPVGSCENAEWRSCPALHAMFNRAFYD
jgi:hypothetical protein